MSASDSLIVYAGHDPECRAYMIDHLIDLFSTYGPEMPLEYIIDRYVVSPEGLTNIDPALRAKASEILQVAVGAVAPDVDLPAPEGPLPLRSVVEQHRYTVLFFYSSTCDHCHQEMPVLKEVWQAFRPKDVEVIGIRACISCVHGRPNDTNPNSKSVSTVTIRVSAGYASGNARNTVVLPEPCTPVVAADS